MDVNSVWRTLSVRGYREDQQVILCHQVDVRLSPRHNNTLICGPRPEITTQSHNQFKNEHFCGFSSSPRNINIPDKFLNQTG